MTSCRTKTCVVVSKLLAMLLVCCVGQSCKGREFCMHAHTDCLRIPKDQKQKWILSGSQIVQVSIGCTVNHLCGSGHYVFFKSTK